MDAGDYRLAPAAVLGQRWGEEEEGGEREGAEAAGYFFDRRGSGWKLQLHTCINTPQYLPVNHFTRNSFRAFCHRSCVKQTKPRLESPNPQNKSRGRRPAANTKIK